MSVHPKISQASSRLDLRTYTSFSVCPSPSSGLSSVSRVLGPAFSGQSRCCAHWHIQARKFMTSSGPHLFFLRLPSLDAGYKYMGSRRDGGGSGYIIMGSQSVVDWRVPWHSLNTIRSIISAFISCLSFSLSLAHSLLPLLQPPPIHESGAARAGARDNTS